MNNGLKILIERMREHPADFDDRHNYIKGHGSLWLACLHEAKELCAKGLFSDEDVQALNEAISGLAVAIFEARVLDALNSPRQEPYDSEKLRYHGQLGASMVATENVAKNILSGATYQDPTLFRKAIK